MSVIFLSCDIFSVICVFTLLNVLCILNIMSYTLMVSKISLMASVMYYVLFYKH